PRSGLKSELALLEQGMIAVAGERLGAALLAVDDRDDGRDFETGLLGAANRLEGRSARGDDVLEDDDARALGDVVLDAALGAVVLRFLADQEAPQGAQRGAGAAPGALDGALPGEAGDVTDDRVGADGRSADGVDRAAVAAGDGADEAEQPRRDRPAPLRAEGRR